MVFARAQQLIKPHRGERLKLGLRSLYILPTRFGWLWLAGGGLLLLVAIQSQRNGPLLLSFLMLGLWLLALHLTQFNLQGLELEALAPSGGFAGEIVAYPLLCRSRCQRDAIKLGLVGSAATPQPPAAGESVLSVPWRAGRRGLMDFARAQQLIKPQRGERLKLGLRNLYILPTRFGWLWLAGCGLLLLVAIQSQRNGPLLLSFLMLGLWLLALHLTQFNLQGLELEALAPSGGFAG